MRLPFLLLIVDLVFSQITIQCKNLSRFLKVAAWRYIQAFKDTFLLNLIIIMMTLTNQRWLMMIMMTYARMQVLLTGSQKILNFLLLCFLMQIFSQISNIALMQKLHANKFYKQLAHQHYPQEHKTGTTCLPRMCHTVSHKNV